ncbi:MAG: tetratricopeptide repeat protein [Deltaproteobacteria bacterium]|nr:tetratricopeptide repeat protein [Deltaproteobacteria bacterium]
MRRPPLLPLVLVMALAGCAHHRPAQDPAGLYKALARHALARGEPARALEVLSEAWRRAPQDPEVLALRGVALREQGLLREAETELAEAVRLRADYAWAHAQYGVLLDLAERREEALPHHEKAVQLEPDNASYLNNLAFSRFARGQLALAIEDYRRAVRLQPADGRIRNNLGFALARSGDFRQAAEQFRHAGPPAEARNNLGFAYELAGNLAQAYELYLEAMRLDPGAKQARANLAHVAARLGRPGVPGLLQPSASEAASGKEQER